MSNMSSVKINGYNIEVINDGLYINGKPINVGQHSEHIKNMEINRNTNLNKSVVGDIKCIGDNITINIEGDLIGNIIDAKNVIVEGDVTGNIDTDEFSCEGDIIGNVTR